MHSRTILTILITTLLLVVTASSSFAQEGFGGTGNYASEPDNSAFCSGCVSCAPTTCKDVEFRGLCDPVSCGSRHWVDVDYLILFSDGFRVPPLVAGSAAGTPRPLVGVLGDPATNVLLGNQRINDDAMSGLRLGFGHWLDDCGNHAMTSSIYFLGSDTVDTFPHNGSDIISRPFFNVDPGVNAADSELVNMAGIVDGEITVGADTDIFSTSTGLQKMLHCCANASCSTSRRMDAFLGYRHFSLEDSLVITEALNSSAANGFLPANTRFDVLDRFETENRFNGVELALLASLRKQRWAWSANSRVAFGNTSQRVFIDGATTVTVPANPAVVQPYGILAVPSNIGTYERDKFGVYSETQLKLGYQVSNRLQLQFGYNFVFLNSVARAGDHVDLTVNGTQIDPNVAVAGPLRPRFDFVDESIFLHGLSFGLNYRF